MRRHTPDPSTLRATRQGDVIGTAWDADTLAWLGIPYAAPPVGMLRWRAPRPHAGWTEPRVCTRFGEMAVQLKSFMTNAPPTEWNRPIGSEDCLTLNVFAPRASRQGALPVIVWIHGGGNTGGSSAGYPFVGNLCAPHDVVVVSVNYRLGIFGWCYHPSLFDASATAEDRSGNFGTLDLIAALRWVRDNIGAFGGDPDTVTVMGESAGGQNVLSLLVSPLARGLFHRAIAQSPVTLTAAPEEGYHLPGLEPEGHRGNISDVLCRLLVAEGLAKHPAVAAEQVRDMAPEAMRRYLLQKDADQIMDMYHSRNVGIYESPRLFRDGHVLPATTLTEALADPAQRADVPVLIGSNRDEMKLFMLMSSVYTQTRFGRIPMMRHPRRYALDAEYFSDMWKALGVDAPLHALYRSGHRQLYCYRFDWDEIPSIPVIRPDILIGATHVMEIPFVFRDLKGVFNPFRTFTPKNRQSREAVTLAMSAWWTRFAHAGAPGDAGGPLWNAWSPGAINTLIIDAEGSGGLRMDVTDVTIDGLKQRIKTDRRLLRNARERCRLYAQLFMNGGLFGYHGDEQEYRTYGANGRATLPSSAFTGRPVL